ncbi:hypothetical protein ARMGADRAFT_1087908 [Armillaria gallica]|uniref:Uncharacterized protein n=1 Tax=Armillaria gallica TaxID=47427 RepID=A0A2H3D7E4_ARMGA|nr:hypothetical protein ARMGADRAFT_1087908 [Armillaria gallica]
MYIPDDENLRGAESQEEPHTEPPMETEPTEDIKPSPGVLQPPKKSIYDLPPGQLGQPNSGGYSMEKKLVNECGWSKEEFESITAEVHALTKTHLNTAVCYKRQADYKVAHICKQMINKHKMLKVFI